jgi:2-hydroxylaminobenzoate mutase
MNPQELIDALDPVLKVVATLDLSDPAAARARLDRDFPDLSRFEALFERAHAEDWLTPKRPDPSVAFGRLAKPGAATANLSIDVVDWEGPGAPHTHPKGEVSLCFPRSEGATFEGCHRGWVVMPPGSRHTPTASGGRMLVAYFLPDGAMAWG